MNETIRFPCMLTIREAARQAGLTEYLVRQLCRAGRVRYVVTGHRWLINADSLAAYLNAGDSTGL